MAIKFQRKKAGWKEILRKILLRHRTPVNDYEVYHFNQASGTYGSREYAFSREADYREDPLQNILKDFEMV